MSNSHWRPKHTVFKDLGSRGTVEISRHGHDRGFHHGDGLHDHGHLRTHPHRIPHPRHDSHREDPVLLRVIHKQRRGSHRPHHKDWPFPDDEQFGLAHERSLVACG